MDSMAQSVIRLTEQALPADQRRLALTDFARAGGWRPSDSLVDYPGTQTVASGHIVVEHGLETSAVLTFLKSRSTFVDLVESDRLRILSISYNNLTDWHLFPDLHGMTVVNNRESPIKSYFFSRNEDPELWRVEAFERISGKLPSPNLKALDDALIGTISIWKRIIASELDVQMPNRQFAALFNIVLLIRAVEDQRAHLGQHVGRSLVDMVQSTGSPTTTSLSKLLRERLGQLGLDNSPLLSTALSELPTLDGLSNSTVLEFVSDFYVNKFAPYRYDFSLISKQALSRIYERYVSVLRDEGSPQQLELFASLPEEGRSTSLGEIYTPQYIARFFSRFLKENMSPRQFRQLTTIDPACGSGIFLRTLLELQCNPEETIDLEAAVDQAFSNVFGLDVDPNACFATTLSLALLHLVLRDSLPNDLHVFNKEALSYVNENPRLWTTFDVVITNPPYIKWDAKPGNARPNYCFFGR